MKYLLLIICMVASSFAYAEEGRERVASVPVDTVVLQGLNKVTTKVEVLEGKIGDSVQFGTLAIDLKNCWKAPPEETPENAVLMDIKDTKAGYSKFKRIFLGWMFSSSPAVSALEHPVYDIVVVDCYNSKE